MKTEKKKVNYCVRCYKKINNSDKTAMLTQKDSLGNKVVGLLCEKCMEDIFDVGDTEKLEKVQIPQFVAEFIKRQKDSNKSLMQALYRPDLSSEWNKKFRNWLGNSDELAGDHVNQELFMKAWLAYPDIEVEQEPKYRVQVGGHFVKFDSEGNMSTTTRSNSITTKPKLHSLGFDLDKAAESGLVKIEELEE